MTRIAPIFQTLLCTAAASTLRGHALWGNVSQPFPLPPSPQAPDNASAARDWWNNSADRDFQHIDRGYVTEHMGDWEIFLPRFFWYGKRVLDYGIGAGYLGETLFLRYPIGSYVGVDISQKALDAAGQVLKPWAPKVQLFLTPQWFHNLAPQIFVSQQVIQHFPSVEYFLQFLNNVNACGAPELMLHFRKSPDGSTKANHAYSTGGDVGAVAMGLVTTHDFIAQYLTHYNLRWFDFRTMAYGTQGEYTKWMKKV